MAMIKVKYIYIIIVLVITNLSPAQNRWQFVNPLPTGFDLFSVNKDSGGNIWLFGEYGTILKSNDDCQSWETVAVNYTENFYDAEIIDKDIWIVGQNGLILISNDEGLSWREQSSKTHKSLLKVQFINKNVGWIMATDSVILRTENGGVDWQEIRINNRWHQNDIYFLNKDKGFLLTGYYQEPNLDIYPWTAGSFYKTDDGGKTWSLIDSGATKYSSIFFLSDQIGYMSIHNYDNGSMLLKTTNAGFNWDTLSYTWSWDQIFFKDEQNGICIGYYYLGVTTDGGINWELKNPINTPSPSSQLTSILAFNWNVIIVGTEGNILKSNDFGQNWECVTKTIDFYYASLRGITFINHQQGFIYGDQYLEFPHHNPILLYTEDGGKSWINKESPDSNYISILKEKDNVIWASSENILYRSENFGDSWKEIYRVDVSYEIIRDIFLFDNNIIFLAGRRLYQSEDGGNRWIRTNEFGVQFLKQFVEINQNKWIILGQNAITEPNYITYDAGKTWNEMDYSFTTIQFLDENIGYAIDGSLYKTKNSGDTWELVSDTVKKIAYWTSKLYFYNEDTGWLNSTDFLYFTNDGGRNWSKEFGIKNIINWNGPALSIVSNSEVWAVGSNGHIFKLSENISNVENYKNNIPDKIKLYQNYPNPFNNQTTISYQLPTNRVVKLEIFNIRSQRVATIVNERQEPNTYTYTWNANGLPSGVYFARLKVAQYQLTKKLLLIK